MTIRQFFYKAILPFRKLYWFTFRPKTTGVKCLIQYSDKFLMIRNTYGTRHWTFPGGGVNLNEFPEVAVLREIEEEVGIRLRKIKKLGTYESNREYKRDTVYCFYAKVLDSRFLIDQNEVSEARWFTIANMPDFRSKAVDKILNMYKT